MISDNGKQFVGREFTSLLKTADLTRATTSPYYPQSNGKIERFNGSLKNECIYPATPLTLEDAKRVVSAYVDHYKKVRLHSATGYVPLAAVLEGRPDAIHEQLDKSLPKLDSIGSKSQTTRTIRTQ